MNRNDKRPTLGGAKKRPAPSGAKNVDDRHPGTYPSDTVESNSRNPTPYGLMFSPGTRRGNEAESANSRKPPENRVPKKRPSANVGGDRSMPKNRKVENDAILKAKKKKTSCKEVYNQYLDNLTSKSELSLDVLAKTPGFVLNAKFETDMDEDELFAHKECEDEDFGKKFEEKTSNLLKKRIAMREERKTPLPSPDTDDLPHSDRASRFSVRYWYVRSSVFSNPESDDDNDDDNDDDDDNDNDDNEVFPLTECKASPYPILERWYEQNSRRKDVGSLEILSSACGGPGGKVEAYVARRFFSTSLSFTTLQGLFDEMRSSTGGADDKKSNDKKSKTTEGDFERKLDKALMERYEKIYVHTKVRFDKTSKIPRLCGKTIGCLEYVKRSNLTTERYAVNLFVFYSCPTSFDTASNSGDVIVTAPTSIPKNTAPPGENVSVKSVSFGDETRFPENTGSRRRQKGPPLKKTNARPLSMLGSTADMPVKFEIAFVAVQLNRHDVTAKGRKK